MTSKTFSTGMAALSKNYTKCVFNPNDKEMAKMWYALLKHIEDEVFMKAVEKILLNEIFAPNLATISKYCSEVAAPLEADDTEGWGMVIKAINNFGYMRAEEAMSSLPYTVRQAVERVGGFMMICQCEEPDVIRGQFNKAMAAINQRERTTRREKVGLLSALALEDKRIDIPLLETQEVEYTDIDFNIGQCKLLKNLARRAKDEKECKKEQATT
ncbi:hypothetical protein CS063_15000 [Sporanaerobium hydrogeniformans]|uniref:Uncharacterized protein n=1 Tax=Sporanaerobium hydrogeniformans TaxID=3072179 RepID=A0AC61DA18_9FIRM|nr:hypothetical protein [Sporanaerobium hydrogeniformans]PHV69551.1 hypothetical protein CS063_15000 [Sporanaerobium hydrogeniformans]